MSTSMVLDVMNTAKPNFLPGWDGPKMRSTKVVYVLKVKRSETSKVMTGRIRLAKTMQDRCRMIELCGGVFYASPTEEQLVPMEPVPHLSRVVAEEQERRFRDAQLQGIDF
jgi:hypothetical protein